MGISADGIDKYLVQVIDRSKSSFVAIPFDGSTCHARLIHGLENQMLIVVRECCRQLLPDRRKLLADLHILRIQVLAVEPFFVVHIDDHVQPFSICHIHDLLDTSKEGRVNRVRTVLGQLAIPGHGNTDGLKASFLDAVDGLFIHARIAPGCFLRIHIVFVAAGSIKCVAEIPAQAHLFDNFMGSLAGQNLRFCNGDLRGNEHHHRQQYA